jgi:hypothetical protein
MMFYLHRLSDQDRRIQRLLLLRHVSGGGSGNHGVRGVVSVWKFRHSRFDGVSLRPTDSPGAEVHRLAELHGGKQGTTSMGGVLVIGAVFISSFFGAPGQSLRLARALRHGFLWRLVSLMIISKSQRKNPTA